ncbi:MAG: EFR1 family ferrodoxin [Ruminococcus sp.]|nr:EFR1 family ferrodoxin [Ruminococcus sp.]
MENILYYFSGTGNSLAAAQTIAQEMGETRLVSMVHENTEDLADDSTIERIGFVFPVYYGAVPPIVRSFIENLKLPENIYIFGVITKGGLAGSVQDELAEIINAAGGKLSYAWTVRMPGNYIAMYPALPDIVQQKLLSSAERKAETIGEKAKLKLIDQNIKADSPPRKSLLQKQPGYLTFAKDYRVHSRCTGCQICAKICPTKNITMVVGKPHFASNCQHCMACIQWCPMGAITYKERTANRARYRHPEIKSEELFR